MTCHDNRWPHVCVCATPIEQPRASSISEYVLTLVLIVLLFWSGSCLVGCSARRDVEPAFVREPLPTHKPQGPREPERAHGWFGEVRK